MGCIQDYRAGHLAQSTNRAVTFTPTWPISEPNSGPDYSAQVMLAFPPPYKPATLRGLFPISPARRDVMAAYTAFLLFDFYGAAGWSDGGPISRESAQEIACLRRQVN